MKGQIIGTLTGGVLGVATGMVKGAKVGLAFGGPGGPWQALSPSASLAASSGFWAETMWASASIIGENSQLLGRHKKALVWHTACQTRAFCYAVLGDVTPYTPALPSRRNQKPQRFW